jgi:hypothetical protein
MITTRINTGLYMVHCKGRVFHVEDMHRASDGDIGRDTWFLYEMVGEDFLTREWWNDFRTKRAAIAAIHGAVIMGEA